MGVEPFLVANSVRAFIAQRLVRVLCPACKRPHDYDAHYLRQIGFPTTHTGPILQGAGCERCRFTGYQGRTAIYEICLVTNELADLITQSRPASALRAAAIEAGMVPLRHYGWQKVIAGVTTIEEVVRVTVADLDLMDE
jgi:general secretion pathway protein E